MNFRSFLDLTDREAIVFDFGAVLANIDYQRCLEPLNLLLKSSGHDTSLEFSAETQWPLIEQYERGEITSERFFQETIKHFKLPCSNEQLQSYWDAIIVSLPLERYYNLKKLKEFGYKIYLLSNINESHEDAIERIIKETCPDFYSVFDQIFFSHYVGLRKPEIEIFEYLMNDQNLSADQILFVDDSKIHTETAKKIGWKVHRVTPPNSLWLEPMGH